MLRTHYPLLCKYLYINNGPVCIEPTALLFGDFFGIVFKLSGMYLVNIQILSVLQKDGTPSSVGVQLQYTKGNTLIQARIVVLSIFERFSFVFVAGPYQVPFFP